jgi:hypothetical protein
VSDAASRTGALRLGIDAEWLTAEAVSPHDPAMRDELVQSSLRLLAVFGLTDRLNLVASVPFVRKELHHAGSGMSLHSTVAGLGDAEVGARWFAWDGTDWEAMRHQSVALSAGTSVPTGEADAREAGVRLDDHAQPGTGAWGPYAGILYRLEQARWHAFASVTYRWRSESRWGYRYGAVLGWTLQGQWQPTRRVALGLGVDGRQAAADRDDGAPVAHTGGFLLAAAPALHVGVTESLWLSLRAQVPFASALRGDQEVGPVLVAGAQWTAR